MNKLREIMELVFDVVITFMLCLCAGTLCFLFVLLFQLFLEDRQDREPHCNRCEAVECARGEE